MIPLSRPALILAFSLSVLPSSRAAETQSLFDGSTLNGWEGTPGMWRIEDGAITGEIANGADLKTNEWIFWKGEVDDFELELDYRITGGPAANSGVQIRSRRADDGHAIGYQADLDAGAEWLGRIYDEHGRELIMERGTRVSISPDGRRWVDPFAEAVSFRSVPKAGDWNHYRIRAAGPHMEVWVNGVFFGALDDHETKAADYSGRIAFQLHAGPGPAKVQFKNIGLKTLGKTALPPALASAAAAAPTVTPSFPATDDKGKVLNLGFEKGNLEDWTAEGDGWAGQPVEGDTVQRRKPGQYSRHVGNFWVGNYESTQNDAGTGVLTSAPFSVTHPWASFLIGGGGEVAAVRAEIVNADTGKVFHTAAGRFEEDMHREIVDMRPLAGQKAFVRLIDRAKNGWGHINFDDFVFHDLPPEREAATGSRVSQSPVLWHLRPNPAKPTPANNAEAQKIVAGMELTDGFQAQLIAAEPEVVQPIAFCMDEKARLWVLEGISYPNKQPEGKGRDRIVILEDRDGDGNFETRTVFMEGLNLASGIEVGFGGVYIGAAPELLFIPDKNHDGKPDGPAEVLLDGWGYQDTHETLNSFTWGPDGWLYGCQGVFTKSLVGKPGTPENQRLLMNAGVWRFHPVRKEFEIFASGGSNQWGLDYNDAGHLFMTHCRSFYGGGGTTHVIRGGQFWNQANGNYAPYISPVGTDFAPGLKNYLPAAAKYDSGEGGAGKPGTTTVYGGHSHVGTLIYQGDNWPDIYRNHLFTHNLHGHQMNHQVNVPQGSGYETMHAGYDMLYTPDPRYIAVDLQTGPDGAVYIIDWCDQQHCHTPIEEKWDRSNGRVYRMSWAATYKPVKADLSSATEAQLAALQTHKNQWYGRTARRLLQERAAAAPLAAETVAALESLADSADASTTLRGLWSLHQTGNLSAARLTKALANPAETVRAWAVQLATEKAGSPRLDAATLTNLAKTDPSPVVRLALASALPFLPAADVWPLTTSLSAHSEDASDRFLPKLIWSGFAKTAASDFPQALAIASKTSLTDLADSIRWYAALTPAGREALTSTLALLPPPAAERAVRIAAFALQSEASLPMPASWPTVESRLSSSQDAAVRADTEQLSAIFGDKAVLARMRTVLANASLPRAERRSAFDILRRTGDPEALPVFAGLLDDPAFRSAVLPQLTRSNDPAIAARLLAGMKDFSPADAASALATLISRPTYALALVKSMEDGGFDKKQLTTLHIRQMRNLKDPALDARLEKVWGKFNESSAEGKASIARLKKTFSEAPLWAYDSAKGQLVFDRVCATCHTMGGGTERKLGPDLAGSWRNGIDYFLENIVDPNAVIGEDFQLVIVTKTDGTVLSGSIAADKPDSLTLRTITETLTIPKSAIRERQKLEQSLMPPGLLESLPEREALELLKFLTSKPSE
ncbi:MAG: PVC-type heme-binding CxxCH protein [Verrucomicrobiota bacterium]